MVKLLGEQGADVHIKGRTGNSAYDIANMIGAYKSLQSRGVITCSSLLTRRRRYATHHH